MMESGDMLRCLDEGISKAKLLMDGYTVNEIFNCADYMKYYSSVYSLCMEKRDLEFVHGIFKKALEDSILSKVLPSVMNKSGESLLKEILRVWENYKSMTKCLEKVFMYLQNRPSFYVSLSDTSMHMFDDMVCKDLHTRFIDAALSLINQDREGVHVDLNLLGDIAYFFAVSVARKDISYYFKFLDAILSDTAAKYSEVAIEWQVCYSASEYVLKVEQCLIEEKARASHFLDDSSVEKLLQVVRSCLLECMSYEDLVSRCSSMKI